MSWLASVTSGRVSQPYEPVTSSAFCPMCQSDRIEVVRPAEYGEQHVRCAEPECRALFYLTVREPRDDADNRY